MRLGCECGKNYDVKDRPAGARVRCRRCGAVLVVPETVKASAAARSASERLRRARGEPCAAHPKTLSTARCDACARTMCEECRAPAPSSHLCTTCSAAVGATVAIPLDFGILATPLIAARTALRALPRILAFNVVANLTKYLLAAPLFFLARELTPPTTASADVFGIGSGIAFTAAIAAALAVFGFFDVVLIPAADIVILDGALRGRDVPFGDDLRGALRRSLRRAGHLFLAFLMILGALAPAVLVVLPFVLAASFATEDWAKQNVIDAGKLIGIALGGVALGAFGLAIPTVVLEHRSAAQSFGRAWTLSRLRPWPSAAIGVCFVVVYLTLLFLNFGANAFDSSGLQSYDAQILGGLISIAVAFALDLAWPSILVAAYHGLVAEEARVVGRRSL